MLEVVRRVVVLIVLVVIETTLLTESPCALLTESYVIPRLAVLKTCPAHYF